MSIYNFDKNKTKPNIDLFEKAKAFLVGQVDKSGKNVKTLDGWKPIKTHSHLVEKENVSIKRGHEALTEKNEGITAEIVKIGKSGKLPKDEELREIAHNVGMRFDKFKEACETSIRAHEAEKDDDKKEAKQKVKVTYNSSEKNTYETSTNGIGFKATINGVALEGFWRPISQYTVQGVDINEVMVGSKRIDIFSGGGSHKTYELYSRGFQPKEKQPKDLRFTGRTFSIDHLKDVFIKKIKEATENPEKNALLTPEFKKQFNIQDIKSEVKEPGNWVSDEEHEEAFKDFPNKQISNDPWVFNEKDFENKTFAEIDGEYSRARNVFDHTSDSKDKNKINKFLDDLMAYNKSKIADHMRNKQAQQIVDKHIAAKERIEVKHQVGSRPAQWIKPYPMNADEKIATVQSFKEILADPQHYLNIVNHFDKSFRGEKWITFEKNKDQLVMSLENMSDDYDKWNGPSSNMAIDEDHKKWENQNPITDPTKQGKKIKIEISNSVSSNVKLQQNCFTFDEFKNYLKQ